jgi:hypothetical protein
MQLQKLSVTLEGSLVTAEGGHVVEPSAGECMHCDLLGTDHDALVPAVKFLPEC